MEELIKFQEDIKKWDNEKILDKLISCSNWAFSKYDVDKNNSKILLLKMELSKRFK